MIDVLDGVRRSLSSFGYTRRFLLRFHDPDDMSPTCSFSRGNPVPHITDRIVMSKEDGIKRDVHMFGTDALHEASYLFKERTHCMYHAFR